MIINSVNYLVAVEHAWSASNWTYWTNRVERGWNCHNSWSDPETLKILEKRARQARGRNCQLLTTESGWHQGSALVCLGLCETKLQRWAERKNTEAQFVAPWHWQSVTRNKRSVADREGVKQVRNRTTQKQILTPETQISKIFISACDIWTSELGTGHGNRQNRSGNDY